MLSITAYNGVLNVLYRDYEIKDVVVSVVRDGGHYNRIEEKSGKWTVAASRDGFVATSGNFAVRFREIKDGFSFVSSYVCPEKIKHAICFRPLFGLTRRITDAVTNGFSESNGNRFNEMQANPRLNRLAGNQTVVSSDSAAVVFGDGTAAAIGAVTFDNYFTEIELCSDGEITVRHELDFRPVATGEKITSDEVAFVAGTSMGDALERYAETTARFNPRPLPPAPTGWCSWYYYGPAISADVIRENMYALKKADVPAGIIQIDDGWQKAQGDWTPNERFPDMKGLADEIKAAGFVPGIWIAPFAASEKSDLFRLHSDWFVKNPDDDGLFGYPSVDFTVPEAAEYLKEIFTRISREWGFRYIKIDLVLHAISAGRHRDAHFNAIKNYRRALAIINEAVTPDTYLISCTAPIGASTGLVDGTRTSSDIFDNWESVRKIALQNLRRYYYDKRSLNVDSDCFLSRTSANEDELCFRPCSRTRDEIRTHAALIAASGGTIMFSDKVSLLGDEQIALYKTLLALRGDKTRPADFDVCDAPSVVVGTEKEGVTKYYAFNFGENVRRQVIPLARESEVYALWREERIGKTSEIVVTLPPHSSEIFFTGDAESVAAATARIKR